MNKALKLAIEKFNNREFFECHDILEDYWFECNEADKDFIQGLLHYAVAFHHLIDKNNPQGAKLQFNKCVIRMVNYGNIYKGIDIKKVIKSSKMCLEIIESGGIKTVTVPKLDLI